MDLSSHFEEMMQRSPIPPQEMTGFLREMRRTPSGTVAVSKLLAGKIQASSEAQAIHAFDFLEAALESETEGSIEFRTEIGRYRFLNEIIRILSPKYLGDKTSESVKERAITFLEDAAGAKRKRWFPSEHSKVNSVYSSLVESGIIQKPTKLADEDAEFQKSIFERGENAVILKKLLQSKDPSDLQAANRLIKNLVDEEARRNERRAELHSLIDRIETSTGLLTEMLNQKYIDKEIVDELVETCRSLRQKLGGVATETNDEATSLLQASENIEQVLVFYESKKETLERIPTNSHEVSEPTTDSTSPVTTSELSLADQLLMNLCNDKIATITQQQTQQLRKPFDEGDNLLLNLDMDFAPSSASQKSELDLNRNSKPATVEPFDEISKLSKEMMEQSLRGMPNSSQLKKTDKTPLSQIKRPSEEAPTPPPKQQTVVPPQPIELLPDNLLMNSSPLLDLDFLDKPSGSQKSIGTNNLNLELTSNSETSHEQPKPRLNSTADDENLLLVLENEKSPKGNSQSNGFNNNSQNTTSPSSTSQKLQVSANDTSEVDAKSSADCGFCLNTVRELDLENIVLIEELKPMELNLEENCKDVCLTLTFGRYPGFPSSVTIAVITLINKNKTTGLLNYVFQLMPPKGWQVKLLPPATMELPAWRKTFLPPPVLTQVALIKLPNSVSKPTIQPKIKYILSYCFEDDTVLHNGDFSVPSGLFR